MDESRHEQVEGGQAFHGDTDGLITSSNTVHDLRVYQYASS